MEVNDAGSSNPATDDFFAAHERLIGQPQELVDQLCEDLTEEGFKMIDQWLIKFQSDLDTAKRLFQAMPPQEV